MSPRSKRDRIRRDLDQGTDSLDKAVRYIGRAAENFEEGYPNHYKALQGCAELILAARDAIKLFRDNF